MHTEQDYRNAFEDFVGGYQKKTAGNIVVKPEHSVKNGGTTDPSLTIVCKNAMAGGYLAGRADADVGTVIVTEYMAFESSGIRGKIYVPIGSQVDQIYGLDDPESARGMIGNRDESKPRNPNLTIERITYQQACEMLGIELEKRQNIPMDVTVSTSYQEDARNNGISLE